MSTRAFAVALNLLGACAGGGCEHNRSQPPARGDNASEERRPAAPATIEEKDEPVTLDLTRFPRKLTNSEAAVSNLNGQIDSLQVALERDPSSALQGAQLVNAWLSRTQFLGTYDDFKRADEVTVVLLDSAANDPATHTLRAAFLSSVHRFEDAEAEIALATELGDDSAANKRTTYDLARGRDLERVLTLREAALEQRSSFAALNDVAAAEAALGRFDQADAHYREALQTYRDVSPLPIAWVFFQRGVMWGEMADQPQAARSLYEEAVRLLPQYVSANVHLAEREHADGDVEAAIERLERIAESAFDPEPKSRLAQYLAERDPARARTLRREVDERYSALLRDYPQAFLDHASEFYANAGADPERALELASQNLTSRTNARAYIVALQAAHAADARERWCALASAASSRAGHNRNLKALLDEPAFECAS